MSLIGRIVTKILERTRTRPEKAQHYFTELFQAMATGGEVLLFGRISGTAHVVGDLG